MAQDVDAYLEGVPEAQRTALEKLRRIITDVVPEATETMGYGMPTFKYHGKTVAHFAAFKNHCSLFPASGTVFEKFEEELCRRRVKTEHYLPVENCAISIA